MLYDLTVMDVNCNLTGVWRYTTARAVILVFFPRVHNDIFHFPLSQPHSVLDRFKLP